MNRLFILCLAMGISFTAGARTINLPGKSFKVCVGKTKKFMRILDQLSHLSGNGVTSRNSTFGVKGDVSRLTLDFDTEYHAKVKCNKPGVDQYDIDWRGSRGGNTFSKRYTIKCIPCLKEKLKTALSKVQDAVEMLKDTPAGRGGIREEYRAKAKHMLQSVTRDLQNLLEGRDISAWKKKQIQKILGLIAELKELLARDNEHSAEVKELLLRIQRLIKKIS